MLAYSTVGFPNLEGLTPCQLNFGRKKKSTLKIETDTYISIPHDVKDYYEILWKRITHFHKVTLELRLERQA